MNTYTRTLSQLKEKAVLFLPPSLLEQADDVSVLPLLFKTQDEFLSILTLSDFLPDDWKKLIDISEEIQANIFLKHELSQWEFKRNGKIPGIGHTNDDTEDTTFDIVAISPNKKYFAIDSVFDLQPREQLNLKHTRQKKRAISLHKAGHHICYGIDGAENINIRERAGSIIYQFSDCTVTFSENKIRFLAQFLKENL